MKTFILKKIQYVIKKSEPILFCMTLLLINSFFITSCNNDDGLKENVMLTKLKDFEKLAELHSEALELFYQEMITTNKFTRDGEKKAISTDLDNFAVDALERLSKNNTMLKFVEKKYSLDGYQTRGGENVNEEMLIYVKNALADFSELNDYNLIRNEIISLISDKEYSKFTEKDQNHIMLTFAIYMDSFNYWNKNIESWDYFLDKNITTRQFMSPGEREMYRTATLCKYSTSDAWGAVCGMATGISAGPIGVLIGWVAGAISGSIGSAIGV